MSDLLPCPFCGSEVELFGNYNPAHEYWVYCECQEASTDKQKIIKAWNTRTENTVISQLAEALRKANELIGSAAPLAWNTMTNLEAFEDATTWDKRAGKLVKELGQALALAEPYLQKKEG